MQAFSYVLGLSAMLALAAADDVTSVILTTQEVVIPSYTTVTEVTTTTQTLQITNTLSQSTLSLIVSPETPTVTTMVPGTSASTTSTVMVTVGGTGTSTAWVTVSNTGVATIFTTGYARYTVTSVVYVGFTTISSCVPTTTVISTVTTAVPTPSAVPGSTVKFQKSTCSAVVCPAGRTSISINGMYKACTLTYYSDDLVSSTCIIEYCCTPEKESDNKVTRTTTCAAAGLVCPAGTKALTSVTGQSVPCVQQYTKNQLTASTCDQTVCCSVDPKTTTVTAGSDTDGSSSSTISCKSAVKCAVYAKSTATNYIKRCKPSECSTAYCCQSVA